MKILDDSVNSPSIRERLRIDLPQVLPPGEYRNAVYDANLAAHFIAGPVKRAQYLAQTNAEQKVRERPLCFVAATHEQELDRMAKIIGQRQVLNERIGVILPTNRLDHGIAEDLTEGGVAAERAVAKENTDKISITFSFANLLPKIATFYMAKSLTFDSVLLPRLTEKAYYWIIQDQRARILFVGIARATQWVYLSTVESSEFQEMAVLREAADQGHLTMQRGGGWRAGVESGRGRAQERAREQDRRD